MPYNTTQFIRHIAHNMRITLKAPNTVMQRAACPRNRSIEVDAGDLHGYQL